MYLSLLSKSVFERRQWRTTLSRSKANHDSGLIDHVAVPKGISSFSFGKLKFDNSIHLVKQSLKPCWSLRSGVGNYRPADFLVFQQPLNCPLVYSTSATNYPRSALLDVLRKMLLKQVTGSSTIDVLRSDDRY